MPPGTKQGVLVEFIIISGAVEDNCENKAGIPVLDGTPSALNPQWKTVLVGTYAPSYENLEVSYVKHIWPHTKVGIVYDGGVPQLVNAFKDAKTQLKRQGVDLVDSEEVEGSESSFVAPMERLRAAGAQTVMMFVVGEAAGILRADLSLGYAPHIYAGGQSGASSDPFAEGFGNLFDGVRALRGNITTNTAAYRAYLEVLRKYEGASAVTSASASNAEDYGLALVLGKMLTLSAPHFTETNFLEAARTINDFNPDGLGPPFTLKGKGPLGEGMTELLPVECCNAQHVYYSTGPYSTNF